MERGGQGNQGFANEKKKNQTIYQAGQALADTEDADKAAALEEGHAGQLLEAGGADDQEFRVW